jgi:hypothetical protein
LDKKIGIFEQNASRNRKKIGSGDIDIRSVRIKIHVIAEIEPRYISQYYIKNNVFGSEDVFSSGSAGHEPMPGSSF